MPGFPESPRRRCLRLGGVLLALAVLLVSPARGDDPQPPSLSIPIVVCLRGSTLLPCPPEWTAPPGGQPQPQPQPPPEPPQVRYDPRRVIVGFKRGTKRPQIDAALERAGLTLERKLPRIRLYGARAEEGRRDEALASLRRESSVQNAEREVLLSALDTTPNDPAWPDQWGLRTASFPKAWDVTRGSRRVVVAMLDTGVDFAHPDLRGALVAGTDVVNRDADPSDDNGHGTATAGVVAARANNAMGLAGVCWTCKVMPVKVLDAKGSGTTSAVAAGIVWAADHGAQVINLSLGAPGTTQALSDAVTYAAGKDVVVVAAAGNSGTTTPFYPAADAAAVSVAASNQSDRLYAWSNHGPWVQVAAPGCNVAPWPGAGYVDFCGTSAAAPLVAGLAALVRSARPQATAQQTVDAVLNAVEQIPEDVRRGRVNAALALPPARPTANQVAARRSTTFRGRLTPRPGSRSYPRSVSAGSVEAVLRFRGARRLSLTLFQRGRRTVRVSGRSPLRLRTKVSAGTIWLTVSGRRPRASFRLKVSYVVS